MQSVHSSTSFFHCSVFIPNLHCLHILATPHTHPSQLNLILYYNLSLHLSSPKNLQLHMALFFFPFPLLLPCHWLPSHIIFHFWKQCQLSTVHDGQSAIVPENWGYVTATIPHDFEDCISPTCWRSLAHLIEGISIIGIISMVIVIISILFLLMVSVISTIIKLIPNWQWSVELNPFL